MSEHEDNEEARLRARFAEIARELNELAEAASSFLISDTSHNIETRKPTSDFSRRSQKALLNAASITYRLRRNRSNLFGDSDLFGEPAWDILLDLFIAELKGVSLSITAVCIGSAVPHTTALRWITVLQQSELLMRADDPRDARRAYLSLTKGGFDLMVSYFEHVLETLEK